MNTVEDWKTWSTIAGVSIVLLICCLAAGGIYYIRSANAAPTPEALRFEQLATASAMPTITALPTATLISFQVMPVSTVTQVPNNLYRVEYVEIVGFTPAGTHDVYVTFVNTLYGNAIVGHCLEDYKPSPLPGMIYKLKRNNRLVPMYENAGLYQKFEHISSK